MKIIGEPKEIYEYEFMVVKLLLNGDYKFHSNHEYAETAYSTAKEVGGVVLHNVRITHKKLRKNT